jgi:predicted Zn-dependent protease
LGNLILTLVCPIFELRKIGVYKLKRLTWLPIGLVLILITALAVRKQFFRHSPEPVSSGRKSVDLDSNDVPTKLPEGLTNEQYKIAENSFQQAFPTVKKSREAVLMMAAEIAAREGQLTRAIACYKEVPTNDLKFGMAARLEEGVALLELNQASAAEHSLREFIEATRVATNVQAGQAVDAFKRLTYILSVQIRQEDRKRVLLDQHAFGLVDPLDSKQLFFPNLLILNSPAGKKRIAAFLENDKDNLQLQVASGRYKTLSGSFDEAVAMLDPLSKKFPKDSNVAAALAEAYFEMGDNEKFAAAMSKCPEFAENETWLLTRMRGELAMEQQRWSDAVKYFEHVLTDDPANAPSQMGLAKAYAQLGLDQQHQQALMRSSILADIRVNLSSVQADAVAACNDLAAKCQKIGMADASQVFLQHAQNIQRAQEELSKQDQSPTIQTKDPTSP